MIGTGLAIVIAFVLTFLFGVKDEPDAEAAPATAEGAAIEVAAPVSGEVVALGQIKDKVFAAGALGNGLDIVPTSGRSIRTARRHGGLGLPDQPRLRHQVR